MKEKAGDRIIQVILLLIIAGGFAAIALIMGGSSSSSSGMPGGMPSGAPAATGAAPSGFGAASGSASGESSAVAVEARAASRQTVSQFIRVNGDVVSDVSVDIYPDASGKLVERRVKLGSYVQKGDIIAVVDPSVPGVVYSKSNIISTISGTITDVNADVGDTVSTATSIAVVGDLSQLSLVTYIPERFITYLKTGLTARVAFEAFPDLTFDARVIQLNPLVDTASRSLEIKLEILNPDPRIRAGMFASMQLITRESRNTLAVPATAVSQYYNEEVVYVVKEDSTVERRTVTTGLSSEDTVEILTGLSEGEVVVTQGTSSVTDGTLVRLVNSSSGGEA